MAGKIGQKRIVRKLVSLAILSAVVYGCYLYAYNRASNTIKGEALKIADHIEGISSQERGAVRELIELAHKRAFDRAFDAFKGIGGNFDGETYIGELFRLMIEHAQRKGKDKLAERIKQEEALVTFHVGRK